MTAFTPRMALAAAVLVLLAGGPAAAQEDLDSGKTPAQLYASDCAICHKSPRGLSQAGGILGLQSFLREHYTASRNSAAVLAAYLQALDRSPLTAAERKLAAKPKSGEGKPKSAKAKGEPKGEAKGSGLKTSEPKTSEPKTSEPKTSEPKTSEPKTSEPKQAKPAEPGGKAGEPEAAQAKAEPPKSAKPAEDAKSAKPAKPDKPEKSD